MRDLYIGGSRRAKKGKIMWKLYLFLFFFLLASGSALKLSAPFLVEKWLNNHGTGKYGYAYTVRDVELSLKEGELTLKDVKVFNPETHVELAQTPVVKLQMDVMSVIRGEERKMNVTADKLDIYISKDLTAEINRISNSHVKKEWYFNLVDGNFSELNFIEKKTDESRTLVRFNDVNLKMKELSTVSVNKKTEVSLTSKMAEGGKMKLVAKMDEEGGNSFWTIQGSMNEFPPEFLSKLAGNALPFSFHEETLNAEITARSIDGKIQGEIVPEIKKLNLIDEKPGFTRQVITRALNEDLTFSLPFTLKDELTLQYADTFKKLKEYRKYPLSSVVSSRTTRLEAMN